MQLELEVEESLAHCTYRDEKRKQAVVVALDGLDVSVWQELVYGTVSP